MAPAVHPAGCPYVPPPPPPSLLERSQRFIEDNQKTLLLGAAVLAAGGAGYYLYSNSGSGSAGSSSGKPSGKKSGKKSKKSKSKSDVEKGKGTDGPLLEEIQQKATDVKEKVQETVGKAEEKVEEKPAEPSHLDGVPADAAALAAMSAAERNTLGVTLKDRGNKLYSKKKYEQAMECYTKAIEVSSKEEAVFYSNRAACYTNLSPPDWESAVKDCDSALALDQAYVKALTRRANCLEELGREEESVRDFTATTILQRFQDEKAAQSVERVLKKLAAKKAIEMLQTREPKLPSSTFISSYLSAFRPHSKPKLPENPTQGDQTLHLAFDALDAADYAHAVSFVNEAIEQGVSWTEGEAEAYNLRGTFKFLIGDSEAAKADLQKSLDLKPDFVQSWVKIASVHMELGDAAGAFGDFEAAIRHNPNDPDIYYHRAQVYFIMGEHAQAIADYEKSTLLDDTFIFSHIQAAVAQYKQQEVQPSMAAFRGILKKFPNRGEPYNYYGELLLDQQRFSDAIEKFDKSLELDKDRKPRNVLPLVNKALAIFQWKQDMAGAEKLCEQALQEDPECDVAVATLAQLCLQQGKIEEAIKWFGESAQLARTEMELINAITYEQASKSQMAFLKNYPEYAERLSQLAQQA